MNKIIKSSICVFKLNTISGIFIIFLTSIMTRRYIRKIKSSKEKKSSKKIHLNNVALNFEIDKALAPQERVITFDDKPNNYNREKLLHESIRNALDAAGNAGLTIRFFNLRLGDRISKIEKAKKVYTSPYLEIETLESNGLKNIKKLIKIPINQLATKDKKELKNYFSLLKNLSKSNYNNKMAKELKK